MPGSDWYSQILDRPVIFTNLVLKCSFLKQSLALDENTWIVNLVITKCCNAHFARWLRHLLRSVAAIKIHLIMREPWSGRSWTSKIFNTVITLDTYQFYKICGLLRKPELKQVKFFEISLHFLLASIWRVFRDEF